MRPKRSGTTCRSSTRLTRRRVRRRSGSSTRSPPSSKRRQRTSKRPSTTSRRMPASQRSPTRSSRWSRRFSRSSRASRARSTRSRRAGPSSKKASTTPTPATSSARPAVEDSARGLSLLFTPAHHEPLVGRPFSEALARTLIERIAARAQRELDAEDGLWPLDPADVEREGEPRASALYHGAAGISWALGELDPGLIDREVVDALEARIVAEADAP